MNDQPGPAHRAYQQRAWGDAYAQLAAADRAGELSAEDLERLGTAAYLTGRQPAAQAWERAHHAFLASGDVPRAVRVAVWLGLTLLLNGEHARGGGWAARAERVFAQAEPDCVERGYVRIQEAMRRLFGGDPDAAYPIFQEVTAVADRFADPDLQALGRLGQGQALLARGESVAGTGMLDEAMVAVTTGEVAPIAAGIVYCAVIVACRDAFDLRRAQEWTAALSRWCDSQPDLKPYRGQCLVHRSEIMQLRGDWADAMAEVRQACVRLADPPGDPALGMALYQQGELLRLRGEFTRAEHAYRRASAAGHPPQPGLALLRLAQGRTGDALAAVRRATAEADGPVERPRMLAAYVEIALAAGDVAAARAAADELSGLADSSESLYLQAVVRSAHGSVLLAEGRPAPAGAVLRRAWTAWQQLAAPYEAAWVRLGMASACRELGDHDSAAMELDAARQVFAQLGAAPALARVEQLGNGGHRPPVAGLTPREREVLRLLATGASNREIASTLVISDKTVARHVANLFTKLGVSSRSAATAYAYRHDLV